LAPTLIANTDLFTWSIADLPGIDPQVAVHKLSIYKEARYVSQKKQKSGEERWLTAKIKAKKLLNVGFIEEAHYTTWLSNGPASNKVLNFLDAYSGYNRIPMATTNMNKTTFITNDTNYFYKVMPFALKNACATYQRLMDKVFNHLMGKYVKVYVDDMVVK